jgi:cell shape-determining protein MreD
MNYAKWAFFIFLTFLIQTQLSIFHSPLNLSVVLVYFFSLKNLPRRHKADVYFGSRSEIKSTVFGAFVGLLEDILSGSIIGPNFFSKGLTGFLTTAAFTEIVFKWTPLLGAVTIVAFTLLDGVIVTGSRIIFTGININVLDALQTTLIQTVVSIPFGIIFKPGKFRLTD